MYDGEDGDVPAYAADHNVGELLGLSVGELRRMLGVPAWGLTGA